MLDVVVVTPPIASVLDVVSIDEFSRHLRLSPSLKSNQRWIEIMTDALTEALGQLEGPTGELNRCIRPCILRRYLNKFPPRNGAISLPYPDLISVDEISVRGSSLVILNPDTYSASSELVSQITPVDSWPGMTPGPRAVSITYMAGYPDVYPPQLKRMIKILAAHYIENPEATINEPRQMAINRRVEFGMDDLRAALRVPLSYDDWE